MKTTEAVVGKTPAPFFVGGALHGLKVPPALLSKSAIVAGGGGKSWAWIYRKQFWWRPGGRGFVFYRNRSISLEDALPIVQFMLARGQL